MALITRFTRLFTADLHALLDRLEEPDVVLKQAIREMEDDLASRAQRIRHLAHERDHLARQLTEIDRNLHDIGEQLDACFRGSDEQLARPLLRRRLELDQLAHRLEIRRDTGAAAMVSERSGHDDDQRQLDALLQRAELTLDSLATPPHPQGVAGVDAPVTDADVEIALLREKQRRSAS
jgi:chromosome segregation ATPase